MKNAGVCVDTVRVTRIVLESALWDIKNKKGV